MSFGWDNLAPVLMFASSSLALHWIATCFIGMTPRAQKRTKQDLIYCSTVLTSSEMVTVPRK